MHHDLQCASADNGTVRLRPVYGITDTGPGLPHSILARSGGIGPGVRAGRHRGPKGWSRARWVCGLKPATGGIRR